MIIKPDWDVFKAKFNHNPQDAFEWFCYLLFCREHNLDKGWFGFKNQSGIEKQPLELNGKVIGFQAKFYEVLLSSKKSELVKTLETTSRDYPELTHLVIYTNKLWGQGQDGGKSKALTAIEGDARSLNIEIIWNEQSFFESDFVCIKNNDLARHFFTNDDHNGWDRFKDWSSTQADINSEYLVDKNIKIISPNQNTNDASNVVEGINNIRNKLNQNRNSVRLVGLSGVGKTRLAQAFFDERIGKNPLSVREVWYCDFGESPDPIPLHFIDSLKRQSKKFIVIVDNCGQEQHGILTKSITSDDSQISLLTIEYDISDDLPEKTEVFKLEPNSPTTVQKVIERHYPHIDNPIPNTISQLTGGNYRLALAIASNISNIDNIAVLNDHQLFKRLFYQNGQINNDHYNIAQIFSLVFSFNIKDLTETQSELQILSDIAEVTPKKAKAAIEELRAKDIIQKRGDFRAVLPHVLANHLSKQAMRSIDADDLHNMFIQMPMRLQRSLIKRMSYLHNNEEVRKFIKQIFQSNGYIGKKFLSHSINEKEFEYLQLLAHIDPKSILNLIEEQHLQDNDYLSRNNPNFVNISYLIKKLAYQSVNFVQAFNFILKIVKTEHSSERNNSILEILKSMFKLYTSESLANLEVKKNVLQMLFNSKEYEVLLAIINSALDFREGGISYLNIDTGEKLAFGYQPKNRNEVVDWIDFLLIKLCELDDRGYLEARVIFANSLESILWKCGSADLVKKYTQKLNKRKFFSEIYYQLKETLQYDRMGLQLNAPQMLQDLENLELYLEPANIDISSLLQAYVYVDDHTLYLYKDSDTNSRYAIAGFSDYGALITYVGNQLYAKDDISYYLIELLSHGNPKLEDIGRKVIDKYSSTDDFLDDLSKIKNFDTKKPPYFLLGCIKRIKENSFGDYKKIIDSLLPSEQCNIFVPWIAIQSSNKKEDFSYLCEIIDNNKDLDYYSLSIISHKKNSGIISNDNYEKILDCLIKNEHLSIVQEILILEASFSSTISEKYIPTLMNLMIIQPERNSYHQQQLLKAVFTSDYGKKNIFDTIYNQIKDEKYITLVRNSNLYVTLKALIVKDTKEFIEKFVENDFLRRKIPIIGDLNKVLYHADNNQALDWIGKNQDRIEYWTENSRFSKISRDLGELKGITWNNIIIDLLNRTNNPSQIIDSVFENSITKVSSYTGSQSQEMRNRLNSIDSFESYLEANGLTHHLPYLETKRNEWIEAIKSQESREVEREKKSEGFDY